MAILQLYWRVLQGSSNAVFQSTSWYFKQIEAKKLHRYSGGASACELVLPSATLFNSCTVLPGVEEVSDYSKLSDLSGLSDSDFGIQQIPGHLASNSHKWSGYCFLIKTGTVKVVLSKNASAGRKAHQRPQQYSSVPQKTGLYVLVVTLCYIENLTCWLLGCTAFCPAFETCPPPRFHRTCG